MAARIDDPVARLMARDIARQLAGPNRPWNARMRRELGPSDEQVEAAIRAMRDAAIEDGN